MALTAAITAGADLTLPEAQTQLSLPASLAPALMQSDASLALAQTSTEAAMFKQRTGNLPRNFGDGVYNVLSDIYNSKRTD